MSQATRPTTETISALPGKRGLWDEFRAFLFFLPHYAKNPRTAVRTLPHFGLGGAILLQAMLALVAGMICGLLTRSLAGFVINTVFFPIQTLLMAWLMTGTLELGFRWWLHRPIEFKKLFVLVLICQIPWVCIRILSAFDWPVDLIGIVAMGFLLNESIPIHFAVTKAETKRVVGSFFAFLVVLWSISLAIHLKDELRFQRAVLPPEGKLFPGSALQHALNSLGL